jgi:hypothetical protein
MVNLIENLHFLPVHNSMSDNIELALFDLKCHGNTSKMWITPTGKVFNTEHSFHYQWALRHREMLKSDFDINLVGLTEASGEDAVRLQMVRQGMFRINHEGKFNRVTCEGRISGFNAQIQQTLLDLVTRFPDHFAELRIHLLDDAVESVAEIIHCNWFAKNTATKLRSLRDHLSAHQS